MGIIVGLRIFEEDSKLSIQTALDVFSVFSKNAGLLRKFAFFFIGIDMLFKSPCWRYPGLLVNECCDLACDGLDLWEELDARRSIRCKVLSYYKGYLLTHFRYAQRASQ